MRGGLIGEQHVTNRVTRYEHALLQRNVWRRNVREATTAYTTQRFCAGFAISERDFVDEPSLRSRNRVVLAFTPTPLGVRVCVCMSGQCVCVHVVCLSACVFRRKRETL